MSVPLCTHATSTGVTAHCPHLGCDGELPASASIVSLAVNPTVVGGPSFPVRVCAGCEQQLGRPAAIRMAP